MNLAVARHPSWALLEADPEATIAVAGEDPRQGRGCRLVR
jgi:hypothetical protein